jgi:fatty-acyl-CoA synthase
LDIGVEKGEHVAIWMPNGLEWVYCFFALTKIGACIIPLNTRFKTNEVEYILKQSDSGTLIIQDKFLNIDFIRMVYEACPELARSPAGELSSEKFPRFRRTVCLGDKDYDGMFSLRKLLKQGGTSEISHIKVKPEDIAVIQYTSGTTGFPKGAMLRQGALLYNAFCMGQRLMMSEQDIIFGSLPFYHVGGLVAVLLMSLVYGGSVCSLQSWDAVDAMAMIEQEKCTVFMGMDTMFVDMMAHKNFGNYDLGSLRVAAAPALPEFMKMLHERLGVEIANIYGLSETSPNVCFGDLKDPIDKRVSAIGKPQPGVELKIVKPGTETELSQGQVGEILVRGWNVMTGYYNKPEETRKVLNPDGWLHTGDLGSLDEEGYLSFIGRFKEMVRVGGENVSVEEIEDFLYKHPKIKLAQIISIPDKRLGEVVAAFVELKEGERATPQEIVDFCKGRIANFKIPKYVRFVKEWPITGSGKIQKFKLRELASIEA